MTVSSQDVHAFWLLTETNGHACRGTQRHPSQPVGDERKVCRHAAALVSSAC
jgi:hypothetical protein